MRLLVIRTSAMGDVALTTPVIAGMRSQYPDVEIIIVTRKSYSPFFSSSDGLQLFFPDFGKRHKGLSGIFRLFFDLQHLAKIDHVIDLHDVLRSKILRFLFRMKDIPVLVIDKARAEKRNVITGKKKVQLKHSVERYADVFAHAGFFVKPSREPSIHPEAEVLKRIGIFSDNNIRLNIGIAPFAKHKLKMWPLENMIQLIELLSTEKKCRFWLFGGKEDSDKIAIFRQKFPDITYATGKYALSEELAIISRLDLMISMDSSNMHMAALTGIRTISIWGGTDPLTGFGAWMQPDNYSIRIPVDDLACRPCTVYGKGICKRGDFACMNWLTPEVVFKKIKSAGLLNPVLNSQNHQ